LVALVAAMAALLIAYSASPVHAAGVCSTTAGTTTCTYSPTGAEDTFEVPEGVSSIRVVATGAPGSSSVFTPTSPGGLGAQVSGVLAVTPGDTLYVNVGGAPTFVAATCYPDNACVGGFNGGGSGGRFAGGGGGASDVRTESRAQDGSLASRLIVAGGGGGAGPNAFCFATGTFNLGGAGGAAGFDGGDGGSCGPVAGGTGGDAGGQSAGSGAGGRPDGQSGSLGLGGNAGGGTGGGGGGGYYGGGSGGESQSVLIDSVPYQAPAGGGGGGSNLVPTGGTAAIATGGPSITISYTVLGDNTAPTVTDTSPLQPKKSDNLTATFSEPVQNVSPQTFILERNIAVKKAPPKYVRVDATVTPSADGLTAVLNPVQDLPKGNYRATITTDVKDLADNKLDQDQDPTNGNQPKVWTFRVAK
jgi:Glycine rich protein/Bacterial Ig-like domain